MTTPKRILYVHYGDNWIRGSEVALDRSWVLPYIDNESIAIQIIIKNDVLLKVPVTKKPAQRAKPPIKANLMSFCARMREMASAATFMSLNCDGVTGSMSEIIVVG